MKKIIAGVFGLCLPLLAQAAETIMITEAKYISNENPDLFCYATSAVANSCNGKTDCAVPVDNNLCGNPDPDPESSKYLSTDYDCTSSSGHNIIEAEGQAMFISCSDQSKRIKSGNIYKPKRKN